ncbi:MAG: FHA domain-containing protein [Bellilinea sp.]
MTSRQRCLIFFIIPILFGVAGGMLPARAQTPPQGRVEIAAVNTELFPRVQITFEAFDVQGNFLRELTLEDVQVIEGNGTNGEETIRPVERLELLQPGLDVIVAINLAPELNTRYAGVRRYEAVLQRLQEWMTDETHSGDRLSISTNSGLQLIRSTEPQEWLTTLENLAQVNLLNEQAGLTAFARALDLVTDIGGDAKPRCVALLVTPLLPPSSLDGVQNLMDRAARLNVPIHIWLTASAQSIAANPAMFDALSELAGQSGGELSIFTGSESLPEIEGYLKSYRYQYRLEYESRLNSSGSHGIALSIRQGEEELRSASQPVFLNIQPPNPIFLSPQTQVERRYFPPNSRNSVLEPVALTYRVIIEFPDGYTRAIRASRLFVNDELVQENTRAPFDVFTWSVEDIQSEQQVEMQVEVEDALGLTGRSIRMPVRVSVESRPPNPWQAALSGNRPLALGAILLSGLLLAGILFFAGRQNRQPAAARRRYDRDPLTQPLPPPAPKKRGTISPASMARRLSSARPAAAPVSSAPAWLRQVSEDGLGNAGSGTKTPAQHLLPLKRRDNLIGSDPLRSQICIPSASVSPVHARIVLNENGEYWIYDHDSLAGTWVNYAPVSAAGCRLHHGDLIHLGFVTLQFETAKPAPQPAPIAQPYQEEE